MSAQQATAVATALRALLDALTLDDVPAGAVTSLTITQGLAHAKVDVEFMDPDGRARFALWTLPAALGHAS